MKQLVITLLSLTLAPQLFAQQWVDEQYSYDSVFNITYGNALNFNGTPTDLLMDVYIPQCANVGEESKWPLLLFIHGGAFLAGDKDDVSIHQLCKSFAKRGYVTASISYRLGFVSDESAWSCNYPNYNCIFATDTTEWYRSYYRGVQDAKGALRYLINRYDQFTIDTNNLFVAGESAGAFLALGVGLMDDPLERPAATYALSNANAPNANTFNCEYSENETFGSTISRPDLGGIEGTIEPTTIDYTIKGIGNFYGGMLTDLLQNYNSSKPKPVIYSFHQPCDMIVPIDSREVFWGLDWCMTNGYNCYAIANTPIVHGSRTIRDWNINNSYGYTMQTELTSTPFPYNFLFGTGSCADQVNNSCHSYDNKTQRSLELANFFASEVSSNQICEVIGLQEMNSFLEIYPNPAKSELHFKTTLSQAAAYQIVDLSGQAVLKGKIDFTSENSLLIEHIKSGIYQLVLTLQDGKSVRTRFNKL